MLKQKEESAKPTMTELDQHHEDISAIKKLIQNFFNAINASDTKALGSHFFPTANLTIIRQEPPRNPSPSYHPSFSGIPIPSTTISSSPASESNEKLQVVIRTTIEKFIFLIDEGQKHRKPGGPVLDEQPDLENTDVKIDGLFGVAWSPFRVTFDGVLHHYGVMAFTVGKDGGGWKIEGLTQSYRRTLGWDEKVGEGRSVL